MRTKGMSLSRRRMEQIAQALLENEMVFGIPESGAEVGNLVISERRILENAGFPVSLKELFLFEQEKHPEFLPFFKEVEHCFIDSKDWS